jgi:molybdopterin-containing oxidoreductase family iron-sulfur binding subunit
VVLNVQNVITKRKNNLGNPMGTTKKYWAGVEDLQQTPGFLERQEKEFNEKIPVEEFLSDEKLENSTTGRRDFLKFLGFSVAAASLAACETPVIKAIPYLNKPESAVPGMAVWYASSFYDGQDFASILVKTREGRPIHIKGNKEYGLFKGGINARINSSVLSLYDSERLTHPLKGEDEISWDQADQEIIATLADAKAKGKNVRLLSNSIISPSTRIAIKELLDGLNGEDTEIAKQVTYDAVSYNGIKKANEKSFGKAVIPSYHFNKAKTIVSLSADFLGTWLMSNDYAVQYGEVRNPDGPWMARHYQFESLMSMTGSNADHRVAIKASEESKVVTALYNRIAASVGAEKISIDTSAVDPYVESAVADLLNSKGKSLVVSGSNEESIQLVVNKINLLLGNYGKTIDLVNAINLYQGDDQEVVKLVEEMNQGQVDVLLVYGANPSYNLPNSDSFNAGLEKVSCSVYFGLYADETGTRCLYNLPDHHYLESWNDLSPVSGEYALAQPAISPLYNTRQAQESFLRWNGNSSAYYDFIKATWDLYIPEEEGFFTDIWNKSLLRGIYHGEKMPAEELVFNEDAMNGVASSLKSLESDSGDWELVLYQKTGIGIGSSANNPWLQELPDPITKITWDNYFTVSLADAVEMGANIYLGEKDPASLATLTVNGVEMTLPLVAVPGQKSGTVGVALGYGRGGNNERIGKAAYQTDGDGQLMMEDGKLVSVGKNVYPMVKQGNTATYTQYNVGLTLTGDNYPIALTQTQHTIMERTSVLRETTLETYQTADKEVYNPAHTLPVHEGGKLVQKPVKEIDLWAAHPVEGVGHRWGMSIDLSTCTGCSACVTACHSENNVPVVGKDEIRRARDMHWLRIDRYFSTEMTKDRAEAEGIGQVDMYLAMEVPSNNPQTVHMPMMCQHCNHASCETVCPVAATTHSMEGLNQMTYNRCIGTRYCANNCAYKVRRFNWFNYNAYSKFSEVNPAQDAMARMVLNPDVVVRSRGVMEKCSMCVQRIQKGKLDAKKEGEPVKDGAIQTACSDACPTQAIRFGDLNDTNSIVRSKAQSKLAYLALEEVGTQPNVYYQTKVRNNDNLENNA